MEQIRVLLVLVSDLETVCSKLGQLFPPGTCWLQLYCSTTQISATREVLV